MFSYSHQKKDDPDLNDKDNRRRVRGNDDKVYPHRIYRMLCAQQRRQLIPRKYTRAQYVLAVIPRGTPQLNIHVVA